jgi:seryl-tRNA synthetase
MTTLRVRLPKAVDGELSAEVEKQSVYVSPHLLSLRVIGGTEAELQIEAGANTDEVRGKVEQYLQVMIARFRKLGGKVIHTRKRDRGELGRGVYAELKKRGWVIELGRGQVGLAGPALNAARALDNECVRLGTDTFGAAEQVYPTLIPTEILARCGYFTSFPHAVSMVTHLVEDIDRIEEFRQANAQAPGQLTVPRPDSLLKPEVCLNPAVCYHCYQSLEGKTLPQSGHIVTSVGKCFRYESRNITGLDRLWDFTMREIIFVDTESAVALRREKAIEAAKAQVDAWDLECTIESASDPFFATMFASKVFWQLRGDLKYELRLAVEPGPAGEARSIAAASFNLHEDFFGKTFTITASDGKPCFTGCAAWGIERWVVAAFTQHGFEPARWPQAVRKEVFG